MTKATSEVQERCSGRRHWNSGLVKLEVSAVLARAVPCPGIVEPVDVLWCRLVLQLRFRWLISSGMAVLTKVRWWQLRVINLI